ncbi:ABC-three component system protein [Sphingomonas pseudosanguinis]|uniref:ABC-three component systems C-terminal domain-containing protein n=1 Tax=Sphingomonas pseudosanguinis TaxID=413712 RepID=A0A7W6F1Y2_9SPHN|nr:ABC-three component system protein [Sphingomonas pseudosanguinis]MBB3877800.1 hypothetical protein [Sphingomonas pseudosanguinis]
MPHLNTGVDLEVSIEQLDDVAFASDGEPVERLQAKHHLTRAASLSDSSADLWKTLRVWSEAAAADPSLPSRVKLLLVTTARAPEGSAASMLRPGRTDGEGAGANLRAVRDVLIGVATTSRNLSLRPAFDAFQRLTERMQLSLLSAIEILDGQPTLVDLEHALEYELRFNAPSGKAAIAREMLEGWWWPRVCRALTAVPPEAVPLSSIETKLDEIRDLLKRDALVADMEFAEPTSDEIASYEDLRFVKQLRGIGLGSNRLGYAKQDFYRAFAQRSRWTRQHVVLDDELARFERMLIEEWQPRHAAMCDDHEGDDVDDAKLKQGGQALYSWVETSARFQFRTLTAKFLNVGSYHMLANDARVGWHRDFRRLFGDDV